MQMRVKKCLFLPLSFSGACVELLTPSPALAGQHWRLWGGEWDSSLHAACLCKSFLPSVKTTADLSFRIIIWINAVAPVPGTGFNLQQTVCIFQGVMSLITQHTHPPSAPSALLHPPHLPLFRNALNAI